MMMMICFFLVALLFAVQSHALSADALLFAAQSQDFPPCMPGMTCFKLNPYNNTALIFDCATAAETKTKTANKNVYFMHGNDGPRSKGMWALMMQALAAKGYNTLACDQRGFSPGASPKLKSAYNYDLLAKDIFAIADAYFGKGSRFHAVAHDQGGRVAWHSIGLGHGRTRFASYTTMSEAHSDVFSDALYGPNPDPEQQLNFQYIRQFTLPHSVTAYHQNIFVHVCENAYGYKTPEECQPAIWWYSGAIASGNLAVQPFTGFGPIGKSIGIPVNWTKANTPYPLEGLPQRTRVGRVDEVPVFYICGVGDIADKCTDRFRDGTAKLVGNFSYYRSLECGHNLVSPKECPEYENIIHLVTKFVSAHF